MTETVIEIVPLNMEESSEEKPRHFCGNCHEGFDSEELLEFHCHTCSEKLPFVCGTCQLTFEDEQEMLQHRTNEHQEEMEGIIKDPDAAEISNGMDHDDNEYKPFVCNVCCEAFQSIEILNEHTSVHVENEAMTCNICFSKFTNLDAYLEHRITHEVKEEEGDSEMLYREVKEEDRSSGMSYSCHKCSKTFSSRYSWDQHQKSHSKEHQCKLCGKSFPFKSRLNRHMKIHTDDRPYGCNKCDQRFIHRHNLIDHLQLHEQEEDYHSCAVCKKLFHQKSTLDQHMRTHQENSDQKASETSGDNEMKHVCVCLKKFQSRRDLDQHLKKSACKLHECTLCGKSFSFETELKEHMTIHVGKRPYKCHQCNKAFMRKGHLQSHMYVHNVVHHSCTICKKSFKQEFRLHLHMKTHNIDNHAETPNKCKYCDRVFISPEYLAAHMQEHPKNHLCCDVCLTIFSKSSQLKDHLLQAHNIDRPTMNAESDETTNVTQNIEADTVQQSDEEKETNFPCGYCDESFTLETHLIKHLETHSDLKELKSYRVQDNEEEYNCDKCDKVYQRELDLRKHIHDVHRVVECEAVPKFVCSRCKETFTAKADLVVHLETHRDENVFYYTCKACYKIFNSKDNFDSHQLTCISAHRCTRCLQIFTSKTEYTRHLSTHTHGSSHNFCVECNIIFRDKFAYERHLLKMHMEKWNEMLKSDISGNGQVYFKTPSSAFIGPTGKSPYECEHCGEVIKRSDVVAHLEKHSKEKVFQCKQCDATFATAIEINKHVEKHDSGKIHACTLCNRQCGTQTSLKIHIRKLHPESFDALMSQEKGNMEKGQSEPNVDSATMEPKSEATVANEDNYHSYTCTLCDKQATSQSHLKNRMRTVHPEAFDVMGSQNNDRVEKHQAGANVENGAQMDLNDRALIAETTAMKWVVLERLVQCKHCDALFMTANKLVEHVNNHHANTCTLCGKQASSMTNLKRHMRMLHGEAYDDVVSQTNDNVNAENVQMDLSDQEPKSEAAVTKDVAEERMFQCKHCDALFTTTNRLIDHAYNYHTDGSHTCTFCGRQTSSQTHLRNHMRVVHQGSLGIVVENQTNGNMKKQQPGHNIDSVQMDFSEIKSEDIGENEGSKITTARGPKKFQCYKCHKCSQSFVSVFYLNQHMEKAHNTNVDTVLIRPTVTVYKCEYCCRVFNKSHFLQMHMESHHKLMNTVLVTAGVKLHKCEYCSKVFDTESALQSHGPSCRFSSIRKKESSNCATSDLMYQQHIEKSQIANMNTALQVRRKVVIHKCEYCSKVFNDKPSLQSHRKTHTFQCPSCDFSFHDQQRPNKHLATHVDKSLKCETCQSVFKTKAKYRAHMLIHGTGFPNYPCTKCHKVFIQKTLLNAHMKVHQWEESNHSSPAEKSIQEGNQGQNDQMVTVIKDVQGQVAPKTEKAHQCMKCSRCFKTMEELCEHTEDHCRDKPKKGDYEVNNHLPI